VIDVKAQSKAYHAVPFFSDDVCHSLAAIHRPRIGVEKREKKEDFALSKIKLVALESNSNLSAYQPQHNGSNPFEIEQRLSTNVIN